MTAGALSGAFFPHRSNRQGAFPGFLTLARGMHVTRLHPAPANSRAFEPGTVLPDTNEAEESLCSGDNGWDTVQQGL